MVRWLTTLACLTVFTVWPLEATVELDPTLASLQGRFPIKQPSYQGVEQLLVLSNRWVIVVTSNREALLKQIQIQSGVDLAPLIKEWKERKSNHDHDTYISERKISKIVKEYWITAREHTGERLLDNPDYYRISSESDINYEQEKSPILIERYIAIQGKEPIPGFVADFAQYSYLKLPQPLRSGQTYTIRVGEQRSVSFLYDERSTVSRLIKINQLGYLPNTPHKYAYFGGYIPGVGPIQDLGQYTTFYVLNSETGQKALEGKVQLRERQPRFSTIERELLSGENVYELDLSSLHTPGKYFIVIPGVGRSWPFQVSTAVYGPAFYHAARGLYHQRCGKAIGPPFSNWPRAACHHEPIYESDHVPFTANVPPPKGYAHFDVIGGSIDYSQKTEDGLGGWHDAGDWDRRIEHFLVIFDLLNAYSFAPHKFFDGQLQLPESGNGIPDILDEAEYGLRVWRKSMDERGGVAGAVETWSHPRFNDPNYKWAYTQRTRWASLLYAAGAAYYAQLVQPFSEDRAKQYTESARKAYTFGSSLNHLLNQGKGHPITIRAKTDRGRGSAYTFSWEELSDYSVPYLIAAKLHLYRLTGDDTYLKASNGYPDSDIGHLLKMELHKPRGPYQRPSFGDQDLSPWLYFSIFSPELKNKIDPHLTLLYEAKYLQKADLLQSLSVKDPYRRSKARDRYGKMSWGFGTMTNQARALIIGYLLSGDERFREVALYNIDYMLGANPMGMSWTTGIGWVYPVHIHHRISDTDGIDDPVPGIAIYGPNIRRPWQFEHIWNPTDSVGNKVPFMKPSASQLPLLRRWFSHPIYNVTQNEFTIHETLAAGVFAYAFFLPIEWMPSKALKEQKPRTNASLFGQWYLP